MVDHLISKEEINESIKHFKNNKSVGPDGYPATFFKTFSEILVPVLETTNNAVFLTGKTPSSWSEANK